MDLSPGMTVIKLEHIESTACSWSSHRQSAFSLGIPPVATSKSNASNSASSATERGRIATARHWSMRYACAWLALLISIKIRSYVSSRDSGSSFRVRRTLCGRHCRSVSSWQNTQRNLVREISSLHDGRATDTPTFRRPFPRGPQQLSFCPPLAISSSSSQSQSRRQSSRSQRYLSFVRFRHGGTECDVL